MTGSAGPRPVTPLGILTARLDGRAAAAEAGAATAELRAGLREAADLAGGLDPYVARWTTPESPALQSVDERTRGVDWSVGGGRVFLEQEMLSGHVEGQLLKLLVHATGARRVLEIGMFTGYATLAMAEALPEDGRLVACELDPGVAAFAREGFDASPAGARIEVRVGPAQDTLDLLAAEGQVFDLVFLDADKAGYHGYVDTMLSKDLLADRGLICADNTLMQGEPWAARAPSPNGSAIDAFNRAIAADERVEQVVVPLRDGLTLIRRSP